MIEKKHPTLDIVCRDDGAVLVKNTGKSNGHHWTYGYKKKNGYCEVTIRPRRYSVHRLIAETFITNPEHKPTVDHINRVRDDNRVENLRWATHKEQNENCSTLDNMLQFSVRACDDRAQYNKEYGKYYRGENKSAIKSRKHLEYVEYKKRCDKLGLIHHKCPDGHQRVHRKGCCPITWVGSEIGVEPIYVIYKP